MSHRYDRIFFWVSVSAIYLTAVMCLLDYPGLIAAAIS
jgi:hypothetical protein